jgi:hypothetical protein
VRIVIPEDGDDDDDASSRAAAGETVARRVDEKTRVRATRRGLAAATTAAGAIVVVVVIAPRLRVHAKSLTTRFLPNPAPAARSGSLSIRDSFETRIQTLLGLNCNRATLAGAGAQ